MIVAADPTAALVNIRIGVLTRMTAKRLDPAVELRAQVARLERELAEARDREAAVRPSVRE